MSGRGAEATTGGLEAREDRLRGDPESAAPESAAPGRADAGRTPAPPEAPAPRKAPPGPDSASGRVAGLLAGRSARTINHAYLDEDSKRSVRRGLLKAVAVPGCQIPFPGVEMPMPYGWGTGGIQVTASLVGPSDVLKVIDQGADDTVNAVSIRAFMRRVSGVATTSDTARATIIQTRHRIPETPLKEGQIMVYQVPLPEPLRRLEPRESETRTLHALFEYGLMRLRIYEDVARHGRMALSFDYPCLVNRRHAMSPSPIPAFDNPKLDMSPALHLFGAGREKRLYAVPPWTRVEPFDFEDHPFEPQRWGSGCALCGSVDSFLDELVVGDDGETMTICSDTDHCRKTLAAAELGAGGRDAASARPDAAAARPEAGRPGNGGRS